VVGCNDFPFGDYYTLKRAPLLSAAQAKAVAAQTLARLGHTPHPALEAARAVVAAWHTLAEAQRDATPRELADAVRRLEKESRET
jgi:hypothetical protein